MGTARTLVIVNNVAPVVNAGGDQTVEEGVGVSFSGSFTDAGSLREILMAADRALYTVKRGTKNAVAVG